MTEKIKLHPHNWFLEHGINVPQYIWRSGAFKFEPQAFVLNDERLVDKVYSAEVQIDSLNEFEENPHAPNVYAVAGEPNDAKALYFAAYLVQIYLENTKPPWIVKWERIFGGFDNPLMHVETDPNLLVISNLTPNSTSVKLEKTRDLLEKYSYVPRIVVVSGEDPVTFFARRLYYPLNQLFYHSTSIVKRKVEVI